MFQRHAAYPGNKKRQIWQRKRNTEEGNKPQEDPKDKIGEDLRDSDGDSVEVIRHVGNLLNDDDSPTESELGISLNTGTETETCRCWNVAIDLLLVSNVWVRIHSFSFLLCACINKYIYCVVF